VSLDWQDDTPSKEEANLERFLDDLKRKCDEAVEHSQEIRRQWKEALNGPEWRKALASPARCPACSGAGIIGERTDGPSLFGGPLLWTHSCQWCEGSGIVGLVAERRGVR